MSSKSLTAVTSFVSVIREKTVFVLRLNVRGSQRVAVPIVVIVCCVVAVGLFVAAGATDEMVKIKLTLNDTGEEKGDLHFSLFRGAHNISPRLSSSALETDTEEYLIYDVYEREDILGVYATTVALGVTIILCGITAALAFFNTFGVYSSWLYGPPMLYVLSLVTGFMTAVTIAIFTDYYLWELEQNSVSILKASLPFNLDYLADIYTTQPSFGYSFWLLCGGSVCPLASFFLSWRLLALLDLPRDRERLSPVTSGLEMMEATERHLDNVPPAQIYY